MRNHRAVPLILLALLLPLPAQAALTPVETLAIKDESPFCSFITQLEVIATPKGAFEVVWGDDADDFAVNGRRFGRDLQPTGAPVSLLPAHGGLFFSNLVGTWAGRYELAMNALDFGNNPDNPVVGYRVSLDLEGDPLAPAARFKPQRFFQLAPAAGGDSLQFRLEPPIFGPTACQSQGLLARRIDEGGAALSPESRITRRASAFSAGYPHFAVDRLPDDTYVAVYTTCEKFTGLVARRLNAAGAPVGNPINLPLPGRLGNFGGGNLLVAARGGKDFVAVGRVVEDTANPPFSVYTRAVVNGQVFGPARISPPPGFLSVNGLFDLEASPAGGYLLLFQGFRSDVQRSFLFAQELDARGVPQGAPLEISGGEGFIVNAAAAASLPDGRWIVVTRAQQQAQQGDPPPCHERLTGTVLASD